MNNKIPFVESIPSDWRLIPNKYLFVADSEKVGTNWKQYQLLSLTTFGVKEKEINTGGGKVPDNFEGYQTVKPGQMIFCLFDLDCSAVFSGISNFKGMITSAYNVFSSTDLITNRFIDYWFKYVFSNRYYMMYSKNIRYTITSDMFKSIYTPVPSKKTQNKISVFLENLEFKINQLIFNQKKEILKLKEHKIALITDVISLGLNKTKFSDVQTNPWIRKIPVNWKLTKLKYIFAFNKGYGISKDDIVISGDSKCVRYGEIYTKYSIVFQECFTKTNLSKISNPQYFGSGDVLFTCTGELVEEIGKPVTYLGNDKCLAGGDIIVGHHQQDPVFMAFALNSEIAQKQRSYGKAKLKVVHISADQIGNTLIPLPPLEEQKEIGKYLLNKCSAIDLLIKNKEQKIEKLIQYKKSMIYEYVTGKKRVGDLKYE